MITFYVHKDQLHNFLDLKEPVQLINYVMSNDYFELQFPVEEVQINYYRTHSTIELKTFKKGFKNLWKKKK